MPDDSQKILLNTNYDIQTNYNYYQFQRLTNKRSRKIDLVA